MGFKCLRTVSSFQNFHSPSSLAIQNYAWEGSENLLLLFFHSFPPQLPHSSPPPTVQVSPAKGFKLEIAVRAISSLFSHLSASTSIRIVFVSKLFSSLFSSSASFFFSSFVCGKFSFSHSFCSPTLYSHKNCLWENTRLSLTLISLFSHFPLPLKACSSSSSSLFSSLFSSPLSSYYSLLPP